MAAKSTSRNNSPSARVGRSPAYIRLRAVWLPANAHRGCAHCTRAVHVGAPNSDPLQATVDHSVEVDLGLVDPLDTTYWLVACRHCNSRRGAEYRQASERTHPVSEQW